MCFLVFLVFFQEIIQLCDGRTYKKTWLWWVSWPEDYRSKKRGETNEKKLIILTMPVIFAKLWGNKVMIFENLDLAEADSRLTNLLMYFQPQSHSISGEWTIVGFDMVAAWASPGPLPCPECGCRALQHPQGGCHTQDKAVLLQAQALPAHCQNFKYLSSAANHGRKKTP